mgnify:CR=1 FL=1
MGLGPAVALGCALSWAIALVMWRKAGDEIPALILNAFKNGLSLLLLIPTLYWVEGKLWIDISTSDLLLLLASGAVGVGISDGLYLWSLKLIGASRLAIIDCVYSPTIIFLSFFFLGENLTLFQLLGTGLVVLAVYLINSKDQTLSVESKNKLFKGGCAAITAIVSMAVGILIVKPVFQRVPLFSIITLRLLGGTVFSVIALLLTPEKLGGLRLIFNAPRRNLIFAASFVGTYISMVMWVAGFKYNDASIAAVLNQTTTFFTVILAAFFLKEPLTKRKIAATLTATAGVLLITFGK